MKTGFLIERVFHRSRCGPVRPAWPGLWLALVASLGLTLASGHGLHADDRLDLRTEVAQLTAGDPAPPADGTDLHDSSHCVFCRASSDSKTLAFHAMSAASVPATRSTQQAGWATTDQGAKARWIAATAPPRAPPTA